MTDHDIDPKAAYNRRLRYFDDQLLRDQDFIDEQRHHVDRLRRATRAHLSPGRLEGLDMTIDNAPGVRVGKGTAVDRWGRLLVLTQDVVPTGAAVVQGAHIGIVWSTAVPQDSAGARFDDTPQVRLYADSAALKAADAVHLGTVRQENGAWRITPVQPAGLRLPGLAAGAPDAILQADATGLSLRGAGGLSLSDLHVGGRLELAGVVASVGELAFELAQPGEPTVRGLTLSREYAELGTGKNPLRVTSRLSAFALDNEHREHAEIANDTTPELHALVLSGNRSGPRGTRVVRVYDDLLVGSRLEAASLTLGEGTVTAPERLAFGLTTGDASTTKLTIRKTYVEIGGDANPVRFTSAWSKFPDGGKTNCAEISNDTSAAFQALMIGGNRSSSTGRRTVRIYDDLIVAGGLTVDGVRSGGPRFEMRAVTITDTVAVARAPGYQKTQTVTLTAPATRVEAMLAGHQLDYVEDSGHWVNKMHVQASATIDPNNGKSINVTVKVGLSDHLIFDRPFSYTANIVLLYIY